MVGDVVEEPLFDFEALAILIIFIFSFAILRIAILIQTILLILLLLIFFILLVFLILFLFSLFEVTGQILIIVDFFHGILSLIIIIIHNFRRFGVSELLDFQTWTQFQFRLKMFFQNSRDAHWNRILIKIFFTAPEYISNVCDELGFFNHIFTRTILFCLEPPQNHVKIKVSYAIIL